MVAAVAWIPAIALLIAACVARVISKSWFAPSAFSLGIWAVYIIVPLLLAPEYQVSGFATWTLVVLVGAISLGAMLGEGDLPDARVAPAPLAVRQRAKPRALSPGGSQDTAEGGCAPKVRMLPVEGLFRASLVFAAIGLVGAVYYAVVSLRETGMDPSLAAVLLLGQTLYGVYEAGNQQQPLLVRALAIAVFPGAILGGMSYLFAKTRTRKILCFAALVPALLFSLLNATRANTLMAIVLGLSGYLSMRISATTRRLIYKKTLLIGAASVAIASLFFFAVNAVREHKEDSDLAIAIEWPRIKAAGLGYLADFSYWIDHPDDRSFNQLTFGAYTFGGVFDALGAKERESGVYRDFVRLDAEQDNNIFTAFRGAIQDFSLTGAAAVFLLFGFVSGYAYRECSLGNSRWLALLAALYAFLIWSPLGSIFVYNGSLVAFGVVLVATALPITAPLSARPPHFPLESA